MDSTDSAASAAGDKTTVQVYVTDRDRLQAIQRKISLDRGAYVPMFDLVRELVQRAGADLEGA